MKMADQRFADRSHAGVGSLTHPGDHCLGNRILVEFPHSSSFLWVMEQALCLPRRAATWLRSPRLPRAGGWGMDWLLPAPLPREWLLPACQVRAGPLAAQAAARAGAWPPDRKSVGWGKRVSVRVDLGGPRIIKK